MGSDKIVTGRSNKTNNNIFFMTLLFIWLSIHLLSFYLLHLTLDVADIKGGEEML